MAQQNWQDAITKWERAPEEESEPVLFRARVAVVFSVAATVAAGTLFSPPLRPQSLSWVSLILLAGFFLLITSFLSGVVAQMICRATRNFFPALSASVVLAACMGGLWVPAWVVCLREPSILTVLAGCLCVASVCRSLKRYASPAAEPDAQEAPPAGPIYLDDSRVLLRVILPSLLVAMAAEAASVAVLLKKYQLASVLAAGCAAVLVWRFASTASDTGEERDPESSSRVGRSLLMALLFTVVVLMPYLRNFSWAGMGESLMGRAMAVGRVAAQSPEQPMTSSQAYSGVILLPLIDPQKRIIAPRRRDGPGEGFRRMEPMVIPFDGAYWYFKAPDKRPRPTARVVRGSSTKATVRSTDQYPLLMEAHQKLGTRIDLSCCSSVEIALQNADRHPGPIALELWLMDSALPRVMGRYVGTVTIPSSAGVGAASERPAEERLEFPVLPGGKAGEFDEITVVVRSDAIRARTGAQIAIRRFELKP